MVMISATNLEFGHARGKKLRLTHEFMARGLTILLGANGAGKSTLLKTLGGMIPAHSGSRNMPTDIAYLAQENRVFWPVTVGQLLRLSGGELSSSYGDELLHLLSLSELLDQPTNQLSQGQLLRARLARALLTKGDLLLLDEPTAALDPPDAEAIMAALKQHAHVQRPIIMSGHDLTLAAKYGDEFLGLTPDGRCLASTKISKQWLEQIYGRSIAALVDGKHLAVTWETS